MNAEKTKQAWHVLSMTVPIEQAEWLAEQLREQFGVEPVQLERPQSLHAWLEIYGDCDEAIRALAIRIEKEAYPVLALAVRTCDARDWRAFWQLHFKPRAVGQRLMICPDWEIPDDAASDRCILRMVPGLSFGTGEHFTTRFCLEMIDRMAPPGPCRTMWDIGCGSGILGVAAALLGMESVLGTDHDPVCVVQAEENACLNGVNKITTWRAGDLTENRVDAGRYDLVCANVYASLLMQAREAVWSAVGRYLVLSGIREFEADAVADTYLSAGAKEVVRDGDGEWAGLLLERSPT